MELKLGIEKNGVLKDVGSRTAYTGSKLEKGDMNDFRRISTVEADKAQLESFWEESRSDLCQELIGLVRGETEQNGHYSLVLEVSSAFDGSLKESMEVSLFGYFLHSILGKWYIYTNKGEAGAFADKAAAFADDIHRKAVYKSRPKRPKY